ncbi:hypothetical protein HHK36_011507 [Tetracentron sinense]|uniref:RING-type E3 ubiquitin transferase n=1 Tax=Tetracentron sinense TaxID=13715 RepID=A0A834ZCX1_TETSI|nr:hypothetical protein HHK36_011507 [Tetracentron sinense]
MSKCQTALNWMIVFWLGVGTQRLRHRLASLQGLVALASRLLDVQESHCWLDGLSLYILGFLILIPSSVTLMQCPSGHTLCSDCKSKVNNKCPACRKEIGNIRCLVLEKFALSLPLTCRYQCLGCDKVLPYYGKVKHEAQCIFRPYSCPHPGSECSIMGDVPNLLAHLRESHKVDLQTGSTFNHRYVKQDPCSVDNVCWTLTLFNCFDQYFCLHFEAFCLGTEPVYMAFLRFMGEESEARNFVYCLEIGGNGRKLTWQGVPRSIRTNHRSIRDSHDGLIIQRSLALYFSGGDRRELKLRVTGRIWKEL